MTVGICEKIASKKVADTTWNIGPDLNLHFDKEYFFDS